MTFLLLEAKVMFKIKAVSSFFWCVFCIAFFAIPLLQIWGWSVAKPGQLFFLNHLIQFTTVPTSYLILHPLSVAERLLGFTINLIPTMVQLFFLYFLLKLFAQFRKGNIFSVTNAYSIRYAGTILLIGQLIHPFYEVLIGCVVTMNNPPGFRYIKITFDHVNLGIVMAAVLVMLLSWIMMEGYHLQKEQQLTI